MADPARPPAPHQTERNRTRDDLDATLFVQAGAGSGKTSALVTRVVPLVASVAATLDEIAAIFFTEKAGAELRDRSRTALETRAAQEEVDGPAGDTVVAARCRAAL